MANVDRLKRRMLQDLVQQNVDLIHRPVPRMRRSRGPRLLRHLHALYAVRSLRPLGLTAALALLLAASAVLTGSSHLLSSLSSLSSLSAAPRPMGTLVIAAAAAAPAIRAGLQRQAPLPGAVPATLAATALDSSVLPLAVRTIALDAGHGGESHGTTAPGGPFGPLGRLGPLGLVEKDITIDVAQRLRRLLEANHGFRVIMTRQDDAAVSLAERAAIANRRGADIFVSVHVNWIEDRASHGVETYYLGPTHDPYLNRLATAENRDSGYSLADTRQLLDRIYAGVRQDKSRQLAESVQAALFRSLGKVNPRIENRGVKSAPFLVLVATQMPAVLAEVSCLSNAEEASLLAKPLYRQYIAEALAEGLRAYATTASGAAAGDGGSASPGEPQARLR